MFKAKIFHHGSLMNLEPVINSLCDRNTVIDDVAFESLVSSAPFPDILRLAGYVSLSLQIVALTLDISPKSTLPHVAASNFH